MPIKEEVKMINTINILDMFLKPCFVLVEIIAPQRYEKRPNDAVSRPLLFLHQLFNTWRFDILRQLAKHIED